MFTINGKSLSFVQGGNTIKPFNKNSERLLLFTKKLLQNTPSMSVPDDSQFLFAAKDMIAKAQWNTYEVDIASDIVPFGTLYASEKRLIRAILGFFVFGDAIVSSNLRQTTAAIKHTDLANYYGEVVRQENVHNETYHTTFALLLSREEQDQVVASMTSPGRNSRLFQLKSWFDAFNQDLEAVFTDGQLLKNEARLDAAFCAQLFVNSFTEYVPFQTTFAIIARITKLKGLIQSNSYIKRDENVHAMVGVEVYTRLPVRMSRDDEIRIVKTLCTLFLDYFEEVIVVEGNENVFGCTFKDLAGYLRRRANYFLTLTSDMPAHLLPFGPEEVKTSFVNDLKLNHMVVKNNFFEQPDAGSYNNLVGEITGDMMRGFL